MIRLRTTSFPHAGKLTILLSGALVVAALAGWLVIVSLPEGQVKNTPVELPDNVGIEPQFGKTIPKDLRFRDESGSLRELDSFLSDEPVILSLVYFRCPMLCNLSMDGLVRSMRALRDTAGEDFSVLTVSFDPREGHELAAAAKQTAMTRYGREGGERGWHFLTDENDSAKQLANSVGFKYTYDEQSGQYVHAAGIFVLTPEGKISRFLNGVEYAPRDLQLALSEASAGKSGSFTDEILLMCFHYDPTEGKYGLAIFRLMRLAGIVTVVVLGASIYIMSRRDPLKSGMEEESRDW